MIYHAPILLLVASLCAAFASAAPPTSAPVIDTAAAHRAKTERIQLAKTVTAADVSGKTFDVIVIGGTPGGIACAVRAARDGARVLLVNHTAHLGGMMANGLSQWDALYGGQRAPLFSELLANIDRYYVTAYGADSRDRQVARFTQTHYPMGWAESHVAEREFNRLIAAEPNVAALLKHDPVAVQREGAFLRGLTLKAVDGGGSADVKGTVFVDATYEGDLAALAKVPFRVGREARSEYDEPHAGKLFTNIGPGAAPRDAVEGRLNIHPYAQHQVSVDPSGPGTADGAVQAFNLRPIVTNDPANRVMLTEPPARYDRERFVHYDRKSIATNFGPNHKSHMNSPIMPGENHAYPEGDWATRDQITQRHIDFALGLIWFLQNDDSVAPAERRKFREWGLPKDEFVDNGHVPYEMYVREARRIAGRHVYTEHDNSVAPGLGRTPVNADSVAITDWYMDSHACTKDSRPEFHYDGKLILTEESRPGQIPYRSLLPRGVDNLIVPVCLSATHVAWGAVRLEPVWMQTGEVAGVAAAMAVKERVAPAALNADALVRELARRRFMVSFFNDVDVASEATWVPAVEYLGTQGFFHDYDARPNQPLTRATANVWAEGFGKLVKGQLDPAAFARAVREAERVGGDAVTAAEFATMAPGLIKRAGEGTIGRAEAAEWIVSSLPSSRK